jgi:hypothetical protein
MRIWGIPLSKTKNQIPADLAKLLAAADQQRGFPAGTMASVMQQEVGGQMGRFLSDPAAYHYAPNAEGKRIAGHTGKVSTAFGPFGILESTGAQPGYGVKPLADKSLGEQIRFAADYLAARSKQGGSLEAGLAGYGEGTKYAQQVAGRMGQGTSPVQPTLVAMPAVDAVAPAIAPIQAPVQVAQVSPVAPAPGSEPVPAPMGQPVAREGDPWLAFVNNLRRGQPAQSSPITAADLRFGEPALQVNPAQFQAPVVASARPNFEAFGTWGRRA